jgi:hypothetical protein
MLSISCQVLRDETAYRLSDVVYNHCAICISVIHWRKGFVPFLPSRVPNFKFHRCVFIERYCLCQECRTNSRFAVVVELVFDETKDE